MANKTKSLGLTKPLAEEDYNVKDFNDNADKLDDYAEATSKSITKLEANMDNHGHRLEGTSIIGVLPISKGGTGATTASVAVQKLGLDGLTKPCYVVAASDSRVDLKKHTDLVCRGTNDDVDINSLINTVVAGSTIYLLPGTYKFNAPLVIFKAVNLIGSGALTRLINVNSGYILSITSSFVSVQNMQLIRYTNEMEDKSNNSLVEFYSLHDETLSDIKIKGCIFDYKNGEENAQGSIIAVNNPNSLNNLIQLRILENTFVLNDDTFTGCVIDLSNVPSSVSAVVGANVSTQSISIKIKDGKALWTYGQDTTLR